MSTTEIGTTQVPAPPPAGEPRWAPRQVIMLSLAAFLLLGAVGSAAIANRLAGFDEDRREGDYLTTDTRQLETDGHALTIEEIDLEGLEGDWVLGEARLRAAGADPDASVFIGIADRDDARAYLRGVRHSTVDDVDDPDAHYVEHDGGAPTTDPGSLDIWVAQTSGTGTQSLDWTPKDGDWTAVIMNTDGSAGVDVQADVGATVPLLGRFTGGLWITGGVFALAGVVLLVGGLVRTKRR